MSAILSRPQRVNTPVYEQNAYMALYLKTVCYDTWSELCKHEAINLYKKVLAIMNDPKINLLTVVHNPIDNYKKCEMLTKFVTNTIVESYTVYTICFAIKYLLVTYTTSVISPHIGQRYIENL